MIDLRNHAALVTGSTQGVGRAIAVSLATAGADVVVHGHEAGPTAEETLALCREHGVRAELIVGDLAGPTEACVDAVFEAVLDVMPEIDLLANNAGGLFDVPYLEMDVDRFERTMRLNVATPFFLVQRFARRWVEHDVRGRVVVTGSINGRLSEPDHAAYDTSKGAVEAMVRTLCVSLAPHGIRVNGMAPGLVRTPLTNTVLDHDADFLRWMELHTPNGRVPPADVCGPTAAFLLSDLAEHVHGQTWLVDGGMSAWQQPDKPGKQ